MAYYYVSHKNDGAADSYWVNASSCAEARRLVAVNVPEASDAENAGIFECERNTQKTPPEGLIYRRLYGPVSIEAR